MTRGLKQYEKDERQNLQEIVRQMNLLHSNMGGRDNRPERLALHRCMRILQAEIDRAAVEYLKGA